MTVTPETIARMIFLVSNTRYLEREYTKDPTFENRSDMIKYQTLLDDFLKDNEWDGFIAENDIAKDIVITRHPNKIAS